LALCIPEIDQNRRDALPGKAAARLRPNLLPPFGASDTESHEQEPGMIWQKRQARQ
jgi:hypothetical protein